jgi:hypothetical protein
MSAQAEQPGAFSFREPEEFYRPVSGMAVLSFFVSVASLMAFLTPSFWFIPPLALILAFYTSRRVELARKEVAGQLVAKLSIFVALIALIGAPTQFFVQYLILTREARKAGDAYVDSVLQNQIRTSFEYTLHPMSRAMITDDPTTRDEFLRMNQEKYRQVLNMPIYMVLGGKLKESQVTFMGYKWRGYFDGLFHIDLRYDVDCEGTVWVVVLKMKGGVALGGEWKGRQWYIDSATMETLQQFQTRMSQPAPEG